MNISSTNGYTSLPEPELLALVRAGNEEAFTALVHQYSSMIYKISKKVLKNHEDAEDTLQNVLIKAYQRLDSFDGHSRFSTWLFRIAFNEALMTIRRNRCRRQDYFVELSCVDGGGRGISDIQDRRENSERKRMGAKAYRKIRSGIQQLPDTPQKHGEPRSKGGELKPLPVVSCHSREGETRCRLLLGLCLG
jgi:RNA polymerase sigma-70 factor, ECF subfamily